ncbi:trypsin-like cysteine/serine peptidase domain-containing protein [Hyaloraphidium curvatum]|nr:trypsin-like cysteine/serine peptidase domain-containing protein [Hyaloraphidium curvatum]
MHLLSHASRRNRIWHGARACWVSGPHIRRCGEKTGAAPRESEVRVPSAATYPWMALLSIKRADGTFQCGGSMIAPNLVLTAAHCAEGIAPANVTAATYRRNSDATTRRERGIDCGVVQIVVHPRYDFPANDVAILRLSAPTNYGNRTPARIAINRDPSFPPVGYPVRTIRWGITDDGSLSSDLRQADLAVNNASICAALQAFDRPPHPSVLCAGWPGRDA